MLRKLVLREIVGIRPFTSTRPVQAKKTIKQLAQQVPIKNNTVFVRADFNVPVTQGIVQDKTRINLSAPTIRFLLDQGAKVCPASAYVLASLEQYGKLNAQVVVASHLGKPKGKVKEDKRLKPVLPILSKAIKAPVIMAPDSAGPETEALVRKARPGEIVLLENTRFHKEETENAEPYNSQLAALADVYVNDAFGAAHRAHSSTCGITHHMKHKVAGLLMDKEIINLELVTKNLVHPVVACIGGSKVSTKLPVLESLLGKCDSILIGGAMMFTFNKAKGYEIGRSMVEDELIETAREFLEKAEKAGVKVVLPRDFVVAPEVGEQHQLKAIHADVASYKGNGYGVDIGPLTVGDFHNEIKIAKTFFWNGPMGMLEVPRYALGTDAVTRMAAHLSSKDGRAVVGGGDSLVSVQKLDLFDKITHVSTGGGAMLEFIEGKPLPGIEVLDEA